MDQRTKTALDTFASRVAEVPEIEAVWVGGSLATGDYIPGVSDLDLVALTRGELSDAVLTEISGIHGELDAGAAAGLDLGCQYADRASLEDCTTERPTWTHGELIDRSVSLVTRVELARHGYALIGRSPQHLLPPHTREMASVAGQQELLGYWSWAARHPRMFWRHPVMVDLGFTAMARGRHSIQHGALLPKTAAIEQSNAPEWLKEQMRARRRGESVKSPRWRSAYLAWREVSRTTARTRKYAPHD